MKVKQPFTFEEFKTIYSQVPRLTVDLVFINEGKVLLLERQSHGWEGQWHLPGGTVYYRESIVDAAKRVAQEELEVEISVDSFIEYLEFHTEVQERGFGYSVSLAFNCSIHSGEPKTTERGGKVKFFSELPEKMVVQHKQLLQKLLLQ